ncbi:diguanylate phosphodiesterase [Amycolatopsis sp. AA4]|uniref:PP2C family protein-serine/threonine phosphatase n=1 Tax=Actinomycetes TaxID=1760 RepID=UPI0001B5704E|nr:MULTISPECIES: GAF domain-containing SpoIIE family protein phosphatase [Actinomycetes]ATY12285.1 diguanylate phosphodiesterase [Amycolatopsis sp. AA4]
MRPEITQPEPVGAEAAHVGLDDLLDDGLKQVRDAMGADTATVLRHQPGSDQLSAVAAVGLEEEVYQGVRIPIGSGFAGRIAALREPVVIDHVDRGTVVNPLLWERGLRTMLGVPMLAGSTLVGVLHVGCVEPRKFSAADVETLRRLAGQLAVAIQLEVFREDRTAAVALQRSLLPSRLPEIPGLEFAARYVPGAASGLGGDWYDLFPLPGDRLGIVMGDVAGHGLDAAVIMGRLRSALRAYALDCDDPAEVLAKLDRKAVHFEHGVMATVAYAVFDENQHRLQISLAGHLPPTLVSPDRPAELLKAPADPPIGLALSPHPRRVTTVDIGPDTVLAFCTDGLVERRDQLVDTGLARLADVMRVEDPDQLCGRIMNALIGNRRAQDDIALLVIRRTAAA